MALSSLIAFATPVLFGAFLLFFVQPMAGKLLLPLFGGSTSVWNTCLLFFQGTLLAGYAYAHLIVTRLGRVWGPLIHTGLWIAAILVAKQGIPEGIVHSSYEIVGSHQLPVLWILKVLVLWIGLPFLVLSATSSLLQYWFGRIPGTSNPYVLYAASNIGSFLALISYPLVVDPSLHLEDQYAAWLAGLLICGVVVTLCGFWQALYKRTDEANAPHEKPIAITWTQRKRWVFFAFVPSSLLLGVTAYLSTDVAAMPLLWVVPLSLYLLSFVLVFSNRVRLPRILGRILAFLAVICLTGILLDSTSLWFVPVNVLLLFVASLVCHDRASKEKPNKAQLTEFFLCLSIGGALGGLFNGLIAPTIFPDIFEYPTAILLACFCRYRESDSGTWKSDSVYALLIGLITLVLFGFLHVAHFFNGKIALAIAVLTPILLSYRQVKQVRRFSLALLAMFIAGEFTLSFSHTSELLFRDRTFYGVVKVKEDHVGNFRLLYHGSTVHGIQSLDPIRAQTPLAYFSETGPIGNIFQVARTTEKPNRSIGIIGLGVGTLGTYARQGENWSFFEIDPLILRLARDPHYFTYLSERENALSFQYFLGDARVLLSRSNRVYDLLFMDAFSSDSIPAHLITLEAVQLFFERLREGGILVYNISNRYFDFKPVLSSIAREVRATLVVVSDTGEEYQLEEHSGKAPSSWAVLTRSKTVVDELVTMGWAVTPANERQVWTDDFHNLLGILK